MTWHTTKTSDSYTPAVLLHPDGRSQRCNVQVVRLDSVDAARAKLAQGACAVVSKEDAERVRDGEQNG